MSRKLNILFIEDDKSSLLSKIGLLDTEKFEVLAAFSFQEALEQINHRNFDFDYIVSGYQLESTDSEKTVLELESYLDVTNLKIPIICCDDKPKKELSQVRYLQGAERSELVAYLNKLYEALGC